LQAHQRSFPRQLDMLRLCLLSLLLLEVLGIGPQLFTCGANNDATVCSALGDLYNATNGSYWTYQTGWSEATAGTPTDYCTFYGVICSSGVLQKLCVHRNFKG
jgi:hypothetical protein